MKPPIARKIPSEITTHGHTRIDPYFWMNQRENPGVMAYLKAENDYTHHVMRPVKGLMDELFDEMTGRIKKDDETVPYLKNGYYYQTRYRGDAEYPLYYRWRDGEPDKPELLFDVNQLAAGCNYFDDSYPTISPDNRMAAIGIDTVSRRNYTLKFKNLETGNFLSDEIPMTTGGVAWAADNTTLFYTLRDPNTLRSVKVMRHLLGTDPAADVVVYEETDETYSVSVYNSKSNHFIIITSESTLTSEVRILETVNPSGIFRVVEPRNRGHEYEVYAGSDRLFIRTNLDAKNFRIMEASPDSPGKEHWITLIPHHKDVLVEAVELFESFLVIQERYNGLSRFRVYDLISHQSHYISMEEESYVLALSANMELNSGQFRYIYSSLTTPRSVIGYDLKTGKKQLLKETEILGGYDKSRYETRRHYATAPDGIRVPLTLVFRNDTRREEGNPTVLYAYGSYGYSTETWFRSSVVSLLDRGFVYAIAHARGGEEMGREWYEEGKLLKKKNTFTDFIACSEFLIGEKYTTPELLFAMGGSAGGLLMGAISNLRPDLYNGIIASVPFVDVVTTMLDETIPLTTGEYDEWGDPKQKEFYDYMLSYSPYDNVAGREYPHMLVSTGLHDSQVQYWEPAKWVAKLRENNLSGSVILLHTQMEFGHGGASGRFEGYREIALEYAFMLMLL